MEKIRPPYTVEYFRDLIKHAEEFLTNHQYIQVGYEVLCCYNNYRSGWTENISEMYHNPQTPEEQKLVDQMISVIQRTVGGILETAKPSKDYSKYMDLEFVAVQLYRLKDNAPRGMIDTTRNLLIQSQALGAPKLGSIVVPALELLDRIDQPQENYKIGKITYF